MNIRNSGEEIEAANDNKKKNSVSESTFLSAFTRDYVEKRPDAIKNQLIEEVMTQDTLSGTLASTGLAEFRASEEKYNDIELDKIDIYKLRKYLAKGYALGKKAKEDFESYILEQYDVSSDEYSHKIKSLIEGKTVNEIERLLRNDTERERFLRQKLGRNDIAMRKKIDIFDGISPEQIQRRLSAMANPEKAEISGILINIQNGKIPRDDEIRAIVESPLLDDMQKVLFVHTFSPFITLEESKDIGLVDDTKAKKIHKKYIGEITAGSNLSSDNINAISDQLKYSDIRIRTKDFVNSATDAIKISEGVGFEDFVTSYASKQQEVVDSIKQSGPTSFEAMVLMLGEIDVHNNYKNIADFGPERIVKFTKASSSGEAEISYVEIIDFDDKRGEFRFKAIGNERVNLESPSEVQSILYADFVANLQKDKTTDLEVFTKQVLEEKMRKGEIASTELQTLGESDFSGTENTDKREREKNREIESLESKLADKRASLVNTEDEKKKKKIQGEIDDLEKRISDLRNIADISADQAKEWYNKREFLEKLDQLDPDGKTFGFGAHTAFYFGGKIGEKDSKFGTYTLVSEPDYENWTVSFVSEAKLEKDINLDDFVKVFEEKEAKRMKSYQSMEELMAENEAFSGHKFENGKIIAKDAEGGDGKKADREVEYLASSDSDAIVKIVGVSGNIVDIQIGERETIKDPKKLKKNETSHDNLKIKGAPTQQWTLDELKRFMDQEKLKPDWKIGQNMTIVPKNQQNDIKGGVIGRWWQTAYSIPDILKGGKTVFEGIKESLEQGSHVRSAHAALAMGKFLPKELKEDLQSKVEAAESEEMDKALKQLGAVDSWMAVERIEKWLKNKNTPEAKKEAGLLFMLEKYGHLTSKTALYPYRGKFFWYEAFGGRQHDALYNEIKAKVEQDGQVFSEEKLMHMLLKKQCRGPHGFNGIHRRSRLHKEFENKWKSGVNDEFEKGEKDASNFRNAKTMVREGMDEATGGTTSNAFGWAKKAVDRGGSTEDMMHIPSAILLSGACFDLDQVTYNKAKSFWDGEGQPVIAFRMFASQELMKLYNNTVLELSKEIGKAYPNEFPSIGDDAKKLHEMSQLRDESEKERLEAADKFWKQYGEVLSRALNFSLQKDTKYGKIDSIIRRKRYENAVFGEYYKTVRNAVGEGNNFKNDYVDDWAGDTGIFGMNPYKISLKYLFMDQGGGFREKSIAPKIWEKYVGDVESTKDKLFVGSDVNSPENRSAQEEYLADLLQDIIGAFYEMSGLRPDYIFGLNKSTSPVGYNLNKWGLNLQRDVGLVSSTDIMNGNLKDNFRAAARKIISGQGGSNIDTPDVLVSEVQKQAAANLNSRSSRDS